MAQNLTTNIIINAKTGNGFGKVGATLTEMGMIVNGISQQLINFGEESVKVYRQYELSMRDAEVALSTTYGRGTQQLQTVMTQLDTAATNWAATTIFHTDDVSNAISEAAHAGWDLDRIMTGIPAAMQLAQAGGLDLSEAVNYIVKSTYAAGIGFEDLGHFIDLWAFAANSSASTIGEFGDAMLRMGGTMRFAANPEELMTLIAVTANAGAVGSEAGTMIRNSIMRLIAPTDKAKKALAELGATTTETAGLMEDEALAAANAALAAHGFSVYDDAGNLRNILDIYNDLYFALGDIAGGFDNIGRNEDALSILSAIFPTRTITEAINLVHAAAEGYSGLYDAMMGGDATGYGEYASSTMMDTLNGSILTFESKVERLKQLVGEELKPLVQNAAELGGEIVDRIAAMDPGKFSMLVDGLTAIAAIGPGLLVAGAAFRLLGIIATPVGLAATATVATLTTAYTLYEKYQRDFADNFGNMELDSATFNSFLSGLDEQFKSSREQVDQWKEALNQAAQSYETASATFSSKLTTAMITGATLTKADYESLSALADQMFDATLDVFEARASENVEYWGMLFRYDDDNPYLQELIDATVRQVEEQTAEVREAGQNLHNALFQAINNDGEISPEELASIQNYVRQYNDAVAAAMAADEERRSRAAISAKLHKAQSASLEEVKKYAAEISSARDALLETEYDTFLENFYYSSGLDVSEESLAEANRQWLIRRAELTQPYDDALLRLYDMLREEGELSPTDEGQTLAMEHTALGGQEAIDQAKEAYAEAGMTEDLANIERFEQQFTAAGITSTSRVWWNPLTWFKGYETAADQMAWANAMGAAAAGATGATYTPIEQQQAEVAFWQDVLETQAQMAASNPYMFMPPEAAAGAQAGAALAQLLGLGSATVTVTPEVGSLPDMPPVPMPVTPYVEGTDAMTALQDQGVEVSVGADAQELTATIDGADGQTLLEYVTGDAEQLTMTITAEDGKTLVEQVTGNAAKLAAIINSYNGRTITVNISGHRLFAEGGRADTASIFGEAGPEWAIPEEHSERTAALLNAARAASGFTWPDLLARFGGLNANANNQPSTVIYSPVVHAADASGVDAVLREDKKRLEKWWEERKMRDAMEVYA